jgi:hypothetical protein
MPGTITPAQMFDHELNPCKGWPNPYAVDKTKKIADGETLIFAGRVCHIDPTLDQIKIGIYQDNTSASMPLFAFPNQGDFDVSSDVGNISGGNSVMLVGVGAYELETTEFVGVGFDPNIPCTVSMAADANDGKLKATTLHSHDLIVAIVSDKGIHTNEFKKTFVRFWPVYIPFRAA